MIKMLLQYNGDAVYLAAFVAGIVYLAWLGRREKQSVGKKAALALVLSILLVFNEAVYRILGKFTDMTTYYRFFWMLPVLFVVAWCITTQLFSKQKLRIVAGICILVAVLAVGNNFFLTGENVHKPQNIYGLDADAIAVADAVMEDWRQGGKLEKTGGEEPKEGPVAALDMYLVYQVRAYEPRIRWGISRKAYLYTAKKGYDYKNGKYKKQQRVIAAVNEGKKEDAKALSRSLSALGIHYLVIRRQLDMDDYLKQISAVFVSDCGQYRIYRV